MKVDELIELITKKEIELIKKAIELHPELLDGQNHFGNTPLIKAVEVSHGETVAYLLEKKANVNIMNNEGFDALLMSRMKKDTTIMDMIKKQSPTINYTRKNWAFSIAIESGYFFIENGNFNAFTDVDISIDRLGDSPLMLAVARNRIDQVKYFLSLQANPNLANNYGTTPLMMAAANVNIDIIKLLLQNGAQKDAIDNNSTTPLIALNFLNNLYFWEEGFENILEKRFEILKMGLLLNGPDNVIEYDGETSLFRAIEVCNNDQIESCKRMIRTGADIFRTTKDSKNIYQIAGTKEKKELIKDSIKECLEKNKAKIKMLKYDEWDTTIFLQLYESSKLIMNGLDLIAPGVSIPRLFLPQFSFLTFGDDEVLVEKLINAGAPVDMKVAYGYTHLIMAAFFSKNKVVDLLLKKGADVNAKDNYGVTPLIAAARKGNLETAIKLINAGADVNLQMVDGRTALILAVANDHKDFIEMLLKNGSDTNLKTNNNFSAIDVTDNKEIINLLKKNKAKSGISWVNKVLK